LGGLQVAYRNARKYAGGAAMSPDEKEQLAREAMATRTGQRMTHKEMLAWMDDRCAGRSV
jgi:hypothetical protein